MLQCSYQLYFHNSKLVHMPVLQLQLTISTYVGIPCTVTEQRYNRKLLLVLHHYELADTTIAAAKPLTLEAALHRFLLAKRSFKKVENWLVRHFKQFRQGNFSIHFHNKNGQNNATCKHGKPYEVLSEYNRIQQHFSRMWLTGS